MTANGLRRGLVREVYVTDTSMWFKVVAILIHVVIDSDGHLFILAGNYNCHD